MNLNGITKADGLKEDDARTLDTLIRVNRQHASRNSTLIDYYEGDVQPTSIGIDTLPENVKVNVSCDWPKKAVTSVSERSRFEGFVLSNGAADETLEQAVVRNSLIGSYGRHVHSELIHGCMFATVTRFGEGDNAHARVRFHTAETSAAIWDDTTGCIGSGFVVANMARPSWAPNGKPIPMEVHMHLPGRIVVLTREKQSTWKADEKELPISRPCMEAFAFRPTGLKPFGESRITKTVMRITDDVLRTYQNMAVSSALYAAPQKYILGLTPEAFKKLVEEGKMKAYLGAIFLATRDKDGNVPEMGQISPASPQPYIDILRLDAMMFSGATGVPLSSLGIVYDNPASAEAIAASREDICICADDLNVSNGESLRNVALMMMAIEEDGDTEDLSDEQKTVSAKFTDPSMPSIVSQADAAVKIAGADPAFAGTDVFYRLVGLPKEDREELASAKRVTTVQGLLSSFGQSRQPPSQTVEATETVEE